MSPQIRLAVIDDHPLFREGVIRSLAEIGGFDMVAEGSSRDDALRIAVEHRPDVMLIDLSMPGSGLDAIESVLLQRPEQKLVVLTASEATEDITRAMRGGARAYVLKGVGSRTLAEVIRAVEAGETYIAPSLSARMLSALTSPTARRGDLMSTLTPREREILELVSGGLSNKHVALKLDLHEKTVKHHMTGVLAKLKLSNRTEAALAFRDFAEGR